MKTILLLFVLLLSANIIKAETIAEEPTDTDGNGYLNISTLAHLRWLSESGEGLDGKYELDNDIDAEDSFNWNKYNHDNDSETAKESLAWLPIGYSEDESKAFNGEIDGKGHTISNLYALRYELDNAPTTYGFIEMLGENAIIKNLNFEYITFKTTIGSSFFGERNEGKIQNCNFHGTVLGYTFGQSQNTFFLCNVNNGDITACDFEVDFPGKMKDDESSTKISVISNINNGNIQFCNVYSKMRAHNKVSGMCFLNNGVIEDSYSNVFIEAQKSIYSICEKNEGIIRNLECDVELYTQYSASGICHENNGDIENINIKAHIEWNDCPFSINDASGICNINKKNITNVHIKLKMITSRSSAGFCMNNNGGVIEKSSLNILKGSDCIAGSFVYDNKGNIEESFVVGEYNEDDDARTSGFVHRNYKTIKNCYSRCKIGFNEPENRAFCTYNYNGASIINCYHAGEDIHNGSGFSFIRSQQGKMLNTYWDSELHTSDNTGLSGGRTTAEMKNISNFENWDFTNIWNLDPDVNDGYPFFKSTQILSVKDKEIKKESRINVYPNPAIDYINLSLEEKFSDEIVITLLDIQGREYELYRGYMNSSINLDVSKFPSGRYFVRISGENEVESLHFIKR